MSLNHILNTSSNSNFDVKFNDITSNNIDCVTINGNTQAANICSVDPVAIQSLGVIPVFDGSTNEITSTNILIDNDGLNINTNIIKNCQSYKITDNTSFTSADGDESQIIAGGTQNILFAEDRNKLNKKLDAGTLEILTKNIATSENVSSFSGNELNINTFRTRIKTNKNDGHYFIASDGPSDLVTLFLSNNNFNPRMSLYTNGNYNVSTPHINNGGTEGLAFKDSTQEVILCVSNQEKIKMSPTYTNYNATVHNFSGPISSGSITASNITLNDTSKIRWGFRAPLDAVTGYTLSNVLVCTIATENTYVKIPLSSNVIGGPSSLVVDSGSNFNANFTTGDITLNQSGTYLITINISLRKATATGSRFVVIGLGLNGSPPSALVGRMTVSTSSNIDDWNVYSASNIIDIPAFTSYSLWVMMQDLGGTSAANVWIGDLTSSAVKIG